MLKRAKKGTKNFPYVKMTHKTRGKWYITLKPKGERRRERWVSWIEYDIILKWWITIASVIEIPRFDNLKFQIKKINLTCQYQLKGNKHVHIFIHLSIVFRPRSFLRLSNAYLFKSAVCFLWTQSAFLEVGLALSYVRNYIDIWKKLS